MDRRRGARHGGDGGDEPDGGDGKTVVYAGETYSTVTIDGRVWMAENLRYRPSDATFGDGVWNPEAGASAVAELGLLYDYATVTGGAVPTSEGLLRGICPPAGTSPIPMNWKPWPRAGSVRPISSRSPVSGTHRVSAPTAMPRRGICGVRALPRRGGATASPARRKGCRSLSRCPRRTDSRFAA